MTPLDWQESSEKNDSPKASFSPQSLLGFVAGIMSGFAVSMVLMGLLIGYMIRNLL